MVKKLRFLFKNKKPEKYITASDDDIGFAKVLVDSIAEPALKKILSIVNDKLKSRQVRAGMEVKWFFDKIE